MQDAAAAINDLTQNLRVGTIAIGEAGLQIIRFGTGDARLTGAFRTDGIVRALGGLYVGAFTTSQRDSIPGGSRPYGMAILNTTTNRWEWNQGTDTTPVWVGLGGGGAVTKGTLAGRPAPAVGNANSFYFATDDNGGTLYASDGSTWTKVSPGISQPPPAHGTTHHPQLGSDFVTMSLSGTYAARPSATAVAVGVFYYATDQDALYRSTGLVWTRIGAQPGDLFNTLNTTASTGRILLQGQNWPSTTGLYADLYAKWGAAYPVNLPDLRGRVPVALGVHADVNAIGQNDGMNVNSRRPKHNHSMIDPGHIHTFPYSIFTAGAGSSGNLVQGGGSTNTTSATTGVQAGPQTGNEPTDAPAYFVVNVEAKL